MKKRIFKLLLVVLAVSLFSALLLTACQHSEVYYLSMGSDFAVYSNEADVPQEVRLAKGEDGLYTYTDDFASGDQFVIYNVGSSSSVISSVFSSEQHLTLADGKVSVADEGHYALSLDVNKGELSYVFTAPQPQEPTVKSVQITDKVESLTEGETYKFVATVIMSDDSTNANVTWSSSDQNVAIVDADGTVHALAAGTATIKASVGDLVDSVDLTVNKADNPQPELPTVKSVQITDKVASLTEGQTYKFVAKVTMSDDSTNANVTWSSSDQSVATVDADGTVHALAAGSTTITAKAGDDVSDSVQLTVAKAAPVEVPVSSITLSGSELEDGELYLFVGDQAVTINVAVLPANATNKQFTYEIQGESGIVSVTALSSGAGYTVAPLKQGEVTLVVKSVANSQVKAQCVIHVDPVAVQDLTLNPTTIGDSEKFFVDDEQNVMVTVLPANATDKTYSYKLSQEGIVEVSVIDGGYKVKALSVGSVTLNVTSADNEVVTAQCEIIVSELEVTSIEMESTLILEKGEQHQLVPTLKPANVQSELVWTVSPDGIVSVDTDGTVHALAEGTATVTVKAENGVQADCVVTVPKHVTGISMSSGITVYTGEGAKSRDLLVNFIPADATFRDFTVDVEQEGEIIEWVKGEGKITITGKSVGTATVKVTSVDNEEVSASCTITVKDISEAVPYLSVNGIVSILLGDTSSEIEVLMDYGTISKIAFGDSEYVEPVDKSADGTFKFTITGQHIGGSSLKVTVTVGETDYDVTLNFRVTAEYYLLVGTVGGSTNWTDVTEATARENNTLLTQESSGWEITRHFSAGDSFHLVSSFGYPAEGDNGSEMKTNHETHGTMASFVGVARSVDGDNVNIKYAGTYTILLTFGGPNGYTWQVLVEDIDVTTATFESDNGSTLQPGGVESLKLTMTAKPDELKTPYSEQFLNPEDIEWKIDDEHKDVLSIVVDENGEGATITLNNFVGEEEDHATITCTVKGFVATFDITLLPEGQAETPVTEVIFDDQAEVILVDVSNMSLNNWTYTISAHVNEDASVQGVVLSLLLNSNVNGVDGALAFSIENGVINAKMFGTVTIVATSVGNGDGGEPVTATKKVRFYSPTFYMNINWDSSTTSNPSTLQADSSYSIFEWTDVELTAGEPIVFLYQGLGTSDAWTSTIRSNTYWSGSTTNRGGTSGAEGSFAVKESGIYTVTLDLSKVSPAVTFTKTGDIDVGDSITVTAYIINAGTQWTGSDWDDNIIAQESATFQSDADTRTITIILTGDPFTTKAYPNIQFYVVAGTKGTYYGDSASGVTLSGTKYSATKATSKWCKSTGCHMWYQGTVSASTSFTFVFTFDATGGLTAVAIS